MFAISTSKPHAASLQFFLSILKAKRRKLTDYKLSVCIYFIYVLFNNVVGSSDYTVPSNMTTDL